MSESNGQPNIELKGFKLEVSEAKIKVEGGKVYISGSPVDARAEDIKIKIEDGKACILGSSANIKNEIFDDAMDTHQFTSHNGCRGVRRFRFHLSLPLVGNFPPGV